jgi:hypothetical protein
VFIFDRWRRAMRARRAVARPLGSHTQALRPGVASVRDPVFEGRDPRRRLLLYQAAAGGAIRKRDEAKTRAVDSAALGARKSKNDSQFR